MVVSVERAALIRSLDGPGAVEVTAIAPTVAAADEVVVTVACAALNHADVLMSEGKYQVKPALPFSPGAEIAGLVESAPAGSGFAPGDRVVAYLGHGGARERVAVAPWRLVKIPDGVDDRAASGVPVTYGTALHALRDRTQLEAGETMAVLGASGGAGLAAVAIGKLLGARVIAVASAEKHDVCRAHGADVVLDRNEPDLKQALRAAGGPDGTVDVVYDCVGGAQAEPAMRSLRNGGRYLVVGFASRTVPVLPLNIVLVKSLSILGVHWPEAVARDHAAYQADMAFALAAVADGRLVPGIHARLPLTEIGSALATLARGDAAGKIILEIS
jgi:NADPH2:quinone reductase